MTKVTGKIVLLRFGGIIVYGAFEPLGFRLRVFKPGDSATYSIRVIEVLSRPHPCKNAFRAPLSAHAIKPDRRICICICC
jgi:hypothetical protein